MESPLNEKEHATVAKGNKKSTKWYRRLLRIFFRVLVVLLLLNILLYGLLSIPAIQNQLTVFASSQLSKLLKTKVEVGEIRFTILTKASIKDVYIEDQHADTLAYASQIDVRISPLRYLYDREIKVRSLFIDNLYLNTYAKDSISPFNYQFIIDEFSSDTTKTDTTSTSVNLVVDNIELKNGRLNYRYFDVISTPGEFNANDIQLRRVNLRASVSSIDTEKLGVKVKDFSLFEQSGLEIKQLKGNVRSENSRYFIDNFLIETNESKIESNEVFYDIDSEEYSLIVENGKIYLPDFSPFMGNLKELTTPLDVNLTAIGQLPTIDISNVDIKYGEEAILLGSAKMTDYSNLSINEFNVIISKLLLSPDAIASFAKLGDPELELPTELKALGDVNLTSSLTGKLDDFQFSTFANSALGVVKLNSTGSIDTTFTNFDIKANLNTQAFNLKPLVAQDINLGKLSLNTDFNVSQQGADNLVLKLKGKIDTLDVLEGKVLNMPFAASLDNKMIRAGVDAQMNFGRVMFGFEMTRTAKPDINLALNLVNFDVANFYTNPNWERPMLSFKLRGNIKQLDIDDLNADLTIKDINFTDANFDYKPDPFEFKAWKDADKTQYITLVSAFGDLTLKGKYHFSTIAQELQAVTGRYLPNVYSPKVDKNIKGRNDFSIFFKLRNSEELSYIFDLPITIVKPFTLNGNINTIDDKIQFDGFMPKAKTDGLDLTDLNVKMNNVDSLFSLQMNSDAYFSETKYKLNFLAKGANNKIDSRLKIASDSGAVRLNGLLDVNGEFLLDSKKKLITKINILPTDLVVGTRIKMNFKEADITMSEDKTTVNGVGFGINGKPYFSMDGVVSKNPSDSLNVSFTKAQVADILYGLNINDIYAQLDGQFSIKNALSYPEIHTKHFKINDIVLHTDTLGSVDINSQLNTNTGLIEVDSKLIHKDKQVVAFDGFADPKTKKLDMHLDMDQFHIGWLKPYVKDFLSDIDGSISSHLTVTGFFNAPITEGYLGFNQAKVGVEYTNVTYFISDTIEIKPNRIGFQDLILKDSQGNSGVLNARITHRNFKDAKFSLNMKASNLLVLNTQGRTDSLFYGKIFASGNIHVGGDAKGINVDMDISNAGKSNLNITLPQVSEAVDYKSVVYINVPEDKLPAEKAIIAPPKPAFDIPIKIKVKLKVDPTLGIGVVIDPINNDRIEVRGNGNITFNYDLQTELMTLYGGYNMTSGIVKINLQKFLSAVEFKIKEGSKLSFIGDPMSTKFDITAYKPVRADLKTLDVAFDQDQTTRVTVDCILSIVGNINSMDLGYNIQLEDGTDEQKNKVRSLISTNEAKIKQFAYLLAFGSFYSSGGSNGNNVGMSMLNSIASSALSYGLNAVLGNALGEKWEFGAEIGDGDTRVKASTSFFNDRLRLHANVGYRDGSVTSTGTDAFVGDFDLEYILNSLWTLKAYSHTNDSFYRLSPTTQGVGIMFSKQSRSFKGLFQSNKRRRRRNNALPRISTMYGSDSIRIENDSVKLKTDSIKVEGK